MKSLDVTFVECVARQHLPVSYQEAAHFITDVVEFDETQVINRTRLDTDVVIRSAGCVIEMRLRRNFAVQIALGLVAP